MSWRDGLKKDVGRTLPCRRRLGDLPMRDDQRGEGDDREAEGEEVEEHVAKESRADQGDGQIGGGGGCEMGSEGTHEKKESRCGGREGRKGMEDAGEKTAADASRPPFSAVGDGRWPSRRRTRSGSNAEPGRLSYVMLLERRTGVTRLRLTRHSAVARHRQAGTPGLRFACRVVLSMVHHARAVKPSVVMSCASSRCVKGVLCGEEDR